MPKHAARTRPLENGDGGISDADLLASFLSREDRVAEQAFRRLVERHGGAVERVCRDVLGDRHDAQDAAQAAFLVLARKARSIRKPQALAAWLHGVALRVSRRALVAGMKRRETERRRAEAMVHRSESASNAEPARYPELHEEIDRLPEKYRTPIIVCYLQGRTQEEAARMLDWPLGTLLTRLHRGKQRLRDRLARRGVGLISVAGSSLIPPLFESSATAGPPRWTEPTVRAALRFAAGKSASGLVPTAAAQLASDLLRSMFVQGLQTAAAGMLAVGLAATGLVIALGSKQPEQVAAPRTIAVTPKAPAAARESPRSDPDRLPRRPAAAAAKVSMIGDRQRLDRDVAPAEAVAPTDQPQRLGRPALALSDRAEGGHATDASLDRPDVVSKPNGRELFARAWIPNDPRSRGGDGLGPVFNARACVECHDQGGIGGAGSLRRNIEIATIDGVVGVEGGAGFSYSFGMDFGAGRFEYRISNNAPAAPRSKSGLDPGASAAVHAGFREARSLVLHWFGIDPGYQSWRASVPGQHGTTRVRTSQRNPTTLFGTGLIDAIPDEVIVAAASRKPPSSASARVKGRISRTKDGRIGRFGWKGQTASLEEFVRSAAATEMGLESAGYPQAADPRLPGAPALGPDMSGDECDALVEFVRGLPPPPAALREAGDERSVAMAKAGETTFKTIGCAHCHLPRLGDVEGIYSDLLLHDMSPQLADTGSYGVFVSGPARPAEIAPGGNSRRDEFRPNEQEWRTPPLWGLRDSAPYLHDGRAATLDAAIVLHGGQGGVSAGRYLQLSTKRKQQLEVFLMSLGSP